MGVKVLVVDDAADSRHLAATLLRRERAIATVLEATDGVEGVEMVRRERPRIVVMDVRLPRMDGLQATRVIKTEWPETRVVVVTSLRDKAYERDAYAYGADAYLDKGELSTELVATVRRLLA
jgi:DNA-binding NarL/FixJ family response regulator